VTLKTDLYLHAPSRSSSSSSSSSLLGECSDEQLFESVRSAGLPLYVDAAGDRLFLLRAR
jgi:hypothetical protein